MESGWRGGACAAFIILIAIVQVNARCAPNKPCNKKGGTAPVPGCTCMSPNPMLDDSMGAKEKDDGRGINKYEGVIGGPAGSNEVEVLTLDTSIANRVRSANASLAAEIAKLMNVPVSRVNVTPYSWTPDQYGPAITEPIVALLQEDHERCNCHSAAGVVRDQGFKLLESNGVSADVKVAADTSILTVSQFKALNDFAKERATAGDQDDDSQESPARIQLLSRDPCLVKQLISDTKTYSDRIAVFLGVPAEAVVLHPPAVKGTIGLLQLEAKEESQQAPTLLAVKHCDRLPQTMSLLATDQPSRPKIAKAAAAPRLRSSLFEAAPAPALAVQPQSFTVASPDWAAPAPAPAGSYNSTNATLGDAVVEEAPMPRLIIALKLSSVNYDALLSSSVATQLFSALVKGGIAEAASMPAQDLITRKHVELAFYPGDGSWKASGDALKLGTKEDSAEEAITKLLAQDPSVVAPKAAVDEANAVAAGSEGAADSETAGANAGIIVEARVRVPVGSNLTKVGEKLLDTACVELGEPLTGAKDNMSTFVGGDISCLALPPTLEPIADQQPDQENRAWISFWQVVVEPPFAKIGGRRLVEMVNTPGSELARLLPQTLAYVPGVVTDRSMGAVNEAKEVRLPPPEENSAGFGLRSNRFEMEDLQEQAERVKYEEDMERKTETVMRVYEIQEANKAVALAENTKTMIDQARQQFLGAARAHVQALRAPTALTGPEIMPPTREHGVESKYPNIPPTFRKASLAQVSSGLRTVKRSQ